MYFAFVELKREWIVGFLSGGAQSKEYRSSGLSGTNFSSFLDDYGAAGETGVPGEVEQRCLVRHASTTTNNSTISNNEILILILIFGKYNEISILTLKICPNNLENRTRADNLKNRTRADNSSKCYGFSHPGWQQCQPGRQQCSYRH